MSAETRTKVAESVRASMTPQVRAQISEKLRGRPLSDAHRSAISAGMREKKAGGS